jgi:rhomboid protease GluP
MTEGYFTSGREMPEEQNALPERARVITPDMLVQLPARGYEIKNRRLTFEKDMSALPFFILLIITVNVIFFLMELSTGALQSEQALLAAGALKRELVLGGQYWRMISCAFLHGSTGHLVGNMIFLYILGMATEHAFGLPRTAAVYFVAAVSGSLLSIFAHQGPSVGASGAIFGLMGALVMYFWKNRDIFNLRDGNIGLFIAAIAIIQIIMGLSDPYIDINAHIGGFIGGGVIAFFLKIRLTCGGAL